MYSTRGFSVAFIVLGLLGFGCQSTPEVKAKPAPGYLRVIALKPVDKVEYGNIEVVAAPPDKAIEGFRRLPSKKWPIKVTAGPEKGENPFELPSGKFTTLYVSGAETSDLVLISDDTGAPAKGQVSVFLHNLTGSKIDILEPESNSISANAGLKLKVSEPGTHTIKGNGFTANIDAKAGNAYHVIIHSKADKVMANVMLSTPGMEIQLAGASAAG
jgi:hypothetical protein